MRKHLAKGFRLAGSLAFLVVLNSGSAQAGSNSGVHIDKPVVIGDITFNNSIVKLDVVSASFTRAFGFDGEPAPNMVATVPWWGDLAKAESVAIASFDEFYGPLIAEVDDSSSIDFPYVAYGVYVPADDLVDPVPLVLVARTDASGTSSGAVPVSANLPWLRVVEVRAISVPGPVPLFGAAAAFGWSRRLRRSIGRGV
jgi:hypothetical protein